MDSDTEEFLAITEYQMGQHERLSTVILSRIGTPLSPLLGKFLATHFQDKAPVKRGTPKRRSEARDIGLAHAVARYRHKHQYTYEDAIGKVAADTGYSEATVKRAYGRYASKFQSHKFI
jgi:hypothetical protein